MRIRLLLLSLLTLFATGCTEQPTAPIAPPASTDVAFGDGVMWPTAKCYKDATLTYDPTGADREIGCVEMSGDLSVDVGQRNPIRCEAYSARGVKMSSGYVNFGWALSQPVDGAQYMRTTDTREVLLVGNTVTAGTNQPTLSCVATRTVYNGDDQRVTRSEVYKVEPAITISGPTEVYSPTTYRYTANVTGCVGACTYSWLRADWSPFAWRPTQLGTQQYQDLAFTGPATIHQAFYLQVSVTTNGQTSYRRIVVYNKL